MKAVVSVEELRKEYGEFTAVSGSTFEVKKGEIFGIVGPNGAGKTTTLKILSGLLEPTSGTVTVGGYESTEKQMKEQLGFLPEESPLYEDMTGVQYLEFFAQLYAVEEETAKTRIQESLDRLNLEHRNRKIGDMSKGMKRKVAIARSLVNSPDVVVYDEPASGLDPLTTNYVLDFIRDLGQSETTVILSAHNLYHIESICDRLIIMDEGNIVAKGTVEQIVSEHGFVEYQVVSDTNIDGAVKANDKYIFTVESESQIPDVENRIEENGGNVLRVQETTSSLEDIFLSILQSDE